LLHHAVAQRIAHPGHTIFGDSDGHIHRQNFFGLLILRAMASTGATSASSWTLASQSVLTVTPHTRHIDHTLGVNRLHGRGDTGRLSERQRLWFSGKGAGIVCRVAH
jgi:hypothetical protein